jgi:general secretion pathway protein L
MASRIVGVDLGTSSVKVVALGPKRAAPGRSTGRATFDVLAVGEATVPAPNEGDDAAATLRDRQGEALADLKRRGLLDGDFFVTGLPGDEAALKTLVFPFNDREKIAEALPFSLESEISLDLDDVVFPYVYVDRREPRDAKKPKETEVLTAYARKDAVQSVLNTLAVQSIDPRHIELDALSLDALWDGIFSIHEVEPNGPTELRTAGGTVIETTDGAPAPAVALVDIGHRRTSVCVLREGKVVSAHTLLHGGADATRALAREIGLSLEDAERGKRKEAFVEVAGAVAQFAEQQQVSDVLKKAHAPLVRRLRQIFQAAISSSRLRIVKVVLTGGGSKVLNLDRHLAEELNIKVIRGRELSMLARAPNKPAVDDVGESAWAEYAMAFAYALSGLGNREGRIDFRVGPFAWKGDFDFLRERLPALGAWAAALLLTVGLGSLTQAVMLSREESALLEQQLTMCKQITGDEKIDSTSRCIALIRERINGTGGFQVPEHSAVDTFMEVSRRLPYGTELKRKITELDITDDRVRIKGTTTTYEAIDTMVERLQGGACFQLVEKGKARNINAESVEMNITINLDCAQAPGDGKTIAPPPAPTAASLAASSSSSLPSTPVVAPRAQPQQELTPPDEPVPPPDGPRPNISPEQIEARRERLKRLREERENRRRQLLDNPAARGTNMRDRFQKTMPSLRGDNTDDAGDE